MKFCMKTIYKIAGVLSGVMAMLLALCFVFDIYSNTYSMSTDGQLCGSIYAAGALIAMGLYKIELLEDKVDELKGKNNNETV